MSKATALEMLHKLQDQPVWFMDDLRNIVRCVVSELEKPDPCDVDKINDRLSKLECRMEKLESKNSSRICHYHRWIQISPDARICPICNERQKIGYME